MEDSPLSLLYASCFGVSLSLAELALISMERETPSAEVVPLLRPQTQQHLNQIPWRDHWMKLMDQAASGRLKFSSFLSSDYPRQFLGHSQVPLFFTYLGEPVWQTRNFLSIVGSREPMRESLNWMSLHLPQALRELNLSVVSGGARGVDQWAHRIGMASGVSTLVFVPSGLDCIYPNSLNRIIPDVLSCGGAILSGYGLNQEMRVHFFHQRNHWIALMGEASLIVEANLKSGSILTAQMALDLGKDVCTLPMCPWMRHGEGNLRLLRDGATLIVTGEDLSFALSKFMDGKNGKANIDQPK